VPPPLPARVPAGRRPAGRLEPRGRSDPAWPWLGSLRPANAEPAGSDVRSGVVPGPSPVLLRLAIGPAHPNRPPLPASRTWTQRHACRRCPRSSRSPRKPLSSSPPSLPG